MRNKQIKNHRAAVDTLRAAELDSEARSLRTQEDASDASQGTPSAQPETFCLPSVQALTFNLGALLQGVA